MRVVGFSGGADSQAAALWVRRRFPPEEVILLNSDAGGNEHPLTAEFIERYSAEVFPVTVVSALVGDLGGVGSRDAAAGARRATLRESDALTFDRLAWVKGRFPSRRLQFCTQHLKLAPQRRWLEENLDAAGIRYERYAGVRRDESATRAGTPDSACDDYFNCLTHHPVASWSKARVFEFLREAGEEVNPLYKLGFARVGCAPCVNSGKEDVLLWARRFPEMIDKVREWERRVGRPFFAPCVPGMGVNWVDDVVRWAGTVRGGRQRALPLLQARVEAGGCMSRWGLCE